MEKNQTVSVIIPIYNREKYLKRCLDSVVNQTYRELEILLVDDGSTDASRSICEEYAKRDTRIKVIPKENGGVSSARNLGMEHSTGTYLAFADPDDFIHLEFVERLKNLLEQTGAEIAYCKLLDIWENRMGITPKITETTHVWETKRYDWFAQWAHTVACGAVYRRSCVKEIRFDQDLKVGEDTFFLAQCIKKASKIASLESELYFYCHQDESVTQCSYFSGKLTEMTAWEKIVELYADEPLVQKTAKAGYAQTCRELVVKYSKDAAFMQEGYSQAKAGFYKWAGELMRAQFYEKRYCYLLKTIYSYFFWNTWVKRKQGE